MHSWSFLFSAFYYFFSSLTACFLLINSDNFQRKYYFKSQLFIVIQQISKEEKLRLSLIRGKIGVSLGTQ